MLKKWVGKLKKILKNNYNSKSLEIFSTRAQDIRPRHVAFTFCVKGIVTCPRGEILEKYGKCKEK